MWRKWFSMDLSAILRKVLAKQVEATRANERAAVKSEHARNKDAMEQDELTLIIEEAVHKLNREERK